MSDERKNLDKQLDGRLDSQDDQWVESVVTQHLESKAENLDYNVTSKLQAARYRALEQAESKTTIKGSAANWFKWQGLAGSIAVVGLAVFIGMQLYPNTDEPIGVVDQNQIASTATEELMQDMNILSAGDDIDFYLSIEFLEWMESNSG